MLCFITRVYIAVYLNHEDLLAGAKFLIALLLL